MTGEDVGIAICAALIGVAGLVALGVAVVRRPGSGVVVTVVTVASLWVATVSQIALPSGGEPWASALMTLAIPAVLALYPDARLAGVAGWVVSGVAAALGVVYLFGSEVVAQQPWWIVAVAATVMGGLATAIVRYRSRMDTEQHAAVRWALLGGLVTVQGMLVLVIAGQLAGGPGIWGLGLAGLIAAAVLVLAFPSLATVGLLAGSRGPIDTVLRFVVAGSLTLWTVVTSATVAVVLARGAGSSDGTTLATVALLAAVAGIGGWWAGARLADLLVFGGRPDSDRASASTSAAIAGATSVDQLLLVIATQVQRAIGSEGVRAQAYGILITVPSDALEGVETGATFEFVAAGESLGLLSVLPRRAESALTPRDVAVARAIVAAASPALDAARSTQELIDARARLLVAREEERRALRRDLHDDLAPTLVGLGLTASGIARMLHAERSDASAASIAAIAESLVNDLHGAIAQTRAIVHGLRPPVLDELGLVAAIRDRMTSLPDANGLVVRVHASPDPMALPAAVEISALRIVQEAVANVRRHAGATRCDVRIEADTETLILDIVDDGRGMPAQTSGGLGLESMHERARELGGSLQVGTGSGGGTCVHARLPLATSGGGV